jgi:hypothetical protein
MYSQRNGSVCYLLCAGVGDLLPASCSLCRSPHLWPLNALIDAPFYLIPEELKADVSAVVWLA